MFVLLRLVTGFVSICIGIIWLIANKLYFYIDININRDVLLIGDQSQAVLVSIISNDL